jgi:hypothetical protein
MQLSVHGEAFDGLNVFPFRLNCQYRAGIDGVPIQDDGAGAAGGTVTDFLGAGDVQMVAQRIEQGHTRLDVQLAGFAVDSQRDGNSSRPEDCRRALRWGGCRLLPHHQPAGDGNSRSLQEVPARESCGGGIAQFVLLPTHGLLLGFCASPRVEV